MDSFGPPPMVVPSGMVVPGLVDPPLSLGPPEDGYSQGCFDRHGTRGAQAASAREANHRGTDGEPEMTAPARVPKLNVEGSSPFGRSTRDPPWRRHKARFRGPRRRIELPRRWPVERSAIAPPRTVGQGIAPRLLSICCGPHSPQLPSNPRYLRARIRALLDPHVHLSSSQRAPLRRAFVASIISGPLRRLLLALALAGAAAIAVTVVLLTQTDETTPGRDDIAWRSSPLDGTQHGSGAPLEGGVSGARDGFPPGDQVGERTELSPEVEAPTPETSLASASLRGVVRYPSGSPAAGPGTLCCWRGTYGDVRRGHLVPALRFELADGIEGTHAFEISVPDGPFVLSVHPAEEGLVSSVLDGRLGEGAEVGGLELDVREASRPLRGRFIGAGLPDSGSLFVEAFPADWKSVLEDGDSRVRHRDQMGVRLSPDADHRFTVTRSLAAAWTLRFGAFERRHGSLRIEADVNDIELQLEPTARLTVTVVPEVGIEPSSMQVVALQAGHREAAALSGPAASFRSLAPNEPLAIVLWSKECPPAQYSFDSVSEAQGAVLRLEPGEPLVGRVLRADLTPCAQAAVLVEGGPDIEPPFVRASMPLLDIAEARIVRTDADGRFRFDALREGEHTLRVRPVGAVPPEAFPDLHTGEVEHELRLTSERSGELVLEAVDRLSGNRIERFTLGVHRKRAEGAEPGTSTGWRLDGRSGTASELTAGEYGLEINARGYGPRSLEVTIASDERLERRVLLAPTSEASLEMRDEFGSPIPLLHFQLLGEDQEPVRSRVKGRRGTRGDFVTDESGIARLLDVPAGWWLVQPGRRTGPIGQPPLEPTWIWVPSEGVDVIPCTLPTGDQEPARDQRTHFLVACQSPFSSGKVTPFDQDGELPLLDRLPSEMRFEVCRSDGTVHSTSTYVRGDRSSQVTYSSAGTSGTQQYSGDLSFAAIPLLLPRGSDSVVLRITSSGGAATVPLPQTSGLDLGPSMIVLR